MRKWLFILFLYGLSGLITAQTESIEIGSFNIRFFPCNESAEMMKKYNIDMRYPPQGVATDTTALFNFLRKLDIELLGVQEIVDPPLFGKMAKRHLGEQYEFIFASTQGWQKVGFLYDSSVLELIGEPEVYPEISLGNIDRLRPALRGYFKVKNNGFDFHAIVVHLKSSPRGWEQRRQQWEFLEKIIAALPKGEQADADVILLGDFNNVSKLHFEEFLPVLQRQSYYWANAESDTLPSEYYKPNWREARLVGGTIDQIFISSDAKAEFEEGSLKVGGYCAEGKAEIRDEFPGYYLNISDHCPVYGTFRIYPDED